MKTCRTFRHLLLATILAANCLLRIASAQDTSASPAKLDPPVKPTVTGKFIGDGKEAAIKFVLVEERDGFDGKPAVRLIFTEKDPSTAKNPSFDASFRKFGSALVLSVFYDGQIFGCEVAHTAHKKSGFSSVGEIKMPEFKIAGGNVTGHVSTGGTLDAFGQKWEVDLTFAAPLPEKLRTASAPPPGPGARPPTPGDKPAKKSKAAKAAAAAAPGAISAKSLPLPKDATDVQYKALVHQIHLTSGQSVAAVVSELSAGLKEQGWKDGVGGVKGAKNAILKRELGDAKLTIMIQPSPSGSTIKIFADGLNWDGVESAKPAATDNPSAEIDAIKKEAEKAIKDAFKGLPKDLLK